MKYLSAPKIYNKTLTLADTEYSQALSAFPGYVTIQCRTLADIKIAFTATESGTLYITIPGGSSYTIPKEVGWSRTIYMQSTTAGVVVEILEWK